MRTIYNYRLVIKNRVTQQTIIEILDARPPPLPGPFSFIFIQLSGKFSQMIGWHPPGIGAPLGNSGPAPADTHRGRACDSCV